MNNQLRALFLDFDGTIAETERFGHRLAYNRAFKDMHLEWNWDDALYGELLAVAGGKERLRLYIERFQPSIPRGADIDALIAAVHRTKVLHFAHIARGIPFRSGVQRLVYEAHFAGFYIAIVTTASKPGVESLIRQDSAFAHMIDIIASGESALRMKPFPDLYLWVLRKFGLHANQCIAIEDSSIGLKAATSADIPTIVTVSDYTKSDDFRSADSVITQLGDYDCPAETLGGVALDGNIADVPYLRKVHTHSLEAKRSQQQWLG